MLVGAGMCWCWIILVCVRVIVMCGPRLTRVSLPPVSSGPGQRLLTPAPAAGLSQLGRAESQS